MRAKSPSLTKKPGSSSKSSEKDMFPGKKAVTVVEPPKSTPATPHAVVNGETSPTAMSKRDSNAGLANGDDSEPEPGTGRPHRSTRRLRSSTPRNTSETGSIRSKSAHLGSDSGKREALVETVSSEVIAPVPRPKSPKNSVEVIGSASSGRKSPEKKLTNGHATVEESVTLIPEKTAPGNVASSSPAVGISQVVPPSREVEPDQSSASNSSSRTPSKFDQIWRSKPRPTVPASSSPDFLHPSCATTVVVESVSLNGRKRRQPRERFSPETFPLRQRSKSALSPTSSPRTPGKIQQQQQQMAVRRGAESDAERRLRKVEAQRRRRHLARLALLGEIAPGTNNGQDGMGTVLGKKKRRDKSNGEGTKRRPPLTSGDEAASETLVDRIAAAALLDPGLLSASRDEALGQKLFSPDPSLASQASSSQGKALVKRSRMLSLPINPVKPNLPGLFHQRHPLVPVKSRRVMMEDHALPDLASGIPAELPEKSLVTVLTSGALISTQSNIVQARWRYILEARLLVRRSLTYNVGTRRFRSPPTYLNRTVATKRRNLECFVQQLWDRTKSTKEKPPRPSYLYPIDLEVTTFTLLKPTDPTNSPSPTPPSKKEIDVQFAVLKKNPRETLVKDLLAPILTNAVKLRGMAAASKAVTFGQRNKVRLECWNINDFLVVNTESVGTTKVAPKVVAFSVGDIRDGLVLEVAGHFSLKVLVRRPTPSLASARVDYKFVMIYATGHHYQIRDMVAIKHHLKGHACILCSMRCDSLPSLLRHIEALHPSVGHEYDEELKRLYIWFAPEHDFNRAPVPGVVDHWAMYKCGIRDDGSMLMMNPDSSWILGGLTGVQPVFQWLSRRYLPSQPTDCLPKFDVGHILKVYGLAINPVHHYLHTNPVQTIRPDYDQLRDYDSDEDTAWQDQYEQEKIHDFIDCNPQEKQFMCLWNAFTRRISPIFSLNMKEVLCRFVVQHAMEIEMAEAYPALCAQLSIFRREGVITPQESLEVVARYRGMLLCENHAVEPEKKEANEFPGTF